MMNMRCKQCRHRVSRFILQGFQTDFSLSIWGVYSGSYIFRIYFHVCKHWIFVINISVVLLNQGYGNRNFKNCYGYYGFGEHEFTETKEWLKYGFISNVWGRYLKYFVYLISINYWFLLTFFFYFYDTKYYPGFKMTYPNLKSQFFKSRHLG